MNESIAVYRAGSSRKAISWNDPHRWSVHVYFSPMHSQDCDILGQVEQKHTSLPNLRSQRHPNRCVLSTLINYNLMLSPAQWKTCQSIRLLRLTTKKVKPNIDYWEQACLTNLHAAEYCMRSRVFNFNLMSSQLLAHTNFWDQLHFCTGKVYSMWEIKLVCRLHTPVYGAYGVRVGASRHSQSANCNWQQSLHFCCTTTSKNHQRWCTDLHGV